MPLFLRLNFYISHLPHNFFYLFLDRSFHFSLPPDLSPISLHISPVYAASHSLCTRFSPPHLAWEWSDRPHGQQPLLPASISRLRFPPLMCNPRSSSREPMSDFPRPVAPPLLRPQPAQSGPCRPQGYPVQGYLILSSCLHHPHSQSPPLPALTDDPVPCRSQVVALCS